MVFSYDAQGRPFAVEYSANNGGSYITYFYALNQQGDVVKIFRPLPSRDSNGNLNTEVSGNVWLLIAAVAYATSGITMPSPTYTYGS